MEDMVGVVVRFLLLVVVVVAVRLLVVVVAGGWWLVVVVMGEKAGTLEVGGARDVWVPKQRDVSNQREADTQIAR